MHHLSPTGAGFAVDIRARQPPPRPAALPGQAEGTAHVCMSPGHSSQKMTCGRDVPALGICVAPAGSGSRAVWGPLCSRRCAPAWKPRLVGAQQPDTTKAGTSHRVLNSSCFGISSPSCHAVQTGPVGGCAPTRGPLIRMYLHSAELVLMKMKHLNAQVFVRLGFPPSSDRGKRSLQGSPILVLGQKKDKGASGGGWSQLTASSTDVSSSLRCCVHFQQVVADDTDE